MSNEIKNETMHIDVNDLEEVNGGIALRDLKQRQTNIVRLPNMPVRGDAVSLQHLPNTGGGTIETLQNQPNTGHVGTLQRPNHQNGGTVLPLSNLDEMQTI